jgi:hypothetical protein
MAMKPAHARRIEQSFRDQPAKTPFHSERYDEINIQMRAVATFCATVCPDSRQLNSALKCLEEARYWAIKSISANE